MTNYLVISGQNQSFLAYENLVGSEPGVVFLPGLKSDMEGTKAMALEEYCKTKGRSFLRFDYFGHGKSSGKYEDTTIKHWYSSVVMLFQKLQLKPQILVGSSLGGWIGLNYAMRNPARVHGFVGIASAVQFTDQIFENLSQSEKENLSREGFVEKPSEYDDEPYRISAKLIEDGKGFRLFDRDVNLKCPIRLLHGLKDTEVSPAVSRQLLKHVNAKDKTLRLVGGADHRFSDTYSLRIIINAIESIS